MKCFDKRCKEHPCFALRPSGNCEALSDTAFGSKPCPFYQTKEERADKIAECQKRLAKLYR